MEISLENLYVDTGAERVKGCFGSRDIGLHKICSSSMDSSVILTVSSAASISLLWCFCSSVCSKQLRDQFIFWPGWFESWIALSTG